MKVKISKTIWGTVHPQHRGIAMKPSIFPTGGLVVKGLHSSDRAKIPHDYRNNMQGKEFAKRCNLCNGTRQESIHQL